MMSLKEVPLTLFVSEVPGQIEPYIDLLKALAGNNPGFICATFPDVIAYLVIRDEPAGIIIRDELHKTRKPKCDLVGHIVAEAIARYFSLKQSESGTPIILNGFIGGMPCSSDHSHRINKEFPNSHLVHIPGEHEEGQLNRVQLEMVDAVRHFEDLGPVHTLDAEPTLWPVIYKVLKLIDMDMNIVQSWYADCLSPSHAAFELANGTFKTANARGTNAPSTGRFELQESSVRLPLEVIVESERLTATTA